MSHNMGHAPAAGCGGGQHKTWPDKFTYCDLVLAQCMYFHSRSNAIPFMRAHERNRSCSCNGRTSAIRSKIVTLLHDREGPLAVHGIVIMCISQALPRRVHRRVQSPPIALRTRYLGMGPFATIRRSTCLGVYAHVRSIVLWRRL